jgi:hypothetical protein
MLALLGCGRPAMRTYALLVLVTACGVNGALPAASRATCSQDSDCTIPFCPNECNGGQPLCGLVRAYGVDEARNACPCIDTPDAFFCHQPEACLEARCVALVETRAACVSGRCVAVLPDGGSVQ